MTRSDTLPNRAQPFAERSEENRGQGDSYINVSPTERQVSLVVGALLGYFGLTRRSTLGLAFTGAGLALIGRGVTGHCPLSAKLAEAKS